MWKLTPINNSEAIIFDRFDAIYSIAYTMKTCHCFYVSVEDRKLYGCNNEFYCIHAIDIPDNIFIPCSLFFKIGAHLDANIIPMYKSFVLYPSMPWMMLPTATIARHPRFNAVYIDSNDGWKMVDEQGNKLDYLNLYGIDTDGVDSVRCINQLITMVNNKRAIEPFLGECQYFGGNENNPLIQEVFANKASEGCKYMRLTSITGKTYGFMLFKNLFNLNKSDSLTIIIRDRLDNPALYQASFITKKKKSPIPDIITNYIETTYVMFLNI